MSEQHTLSDMVSLDLGDAGKGTANTHVAVCSCGWRSGPQPGPDAATDRLDEHAKTAGQ